MQPGEITLSGIMIQHQAYSLDTYLWSNPSLEMGDIGLRLNKIKESKTE